MINLLHGDNMDLMRSKPDKYYNISIVDPPYGLGDRLTRRGVSSHLKTRKLSVLNSTWDSSIPTPEYFKELFRVSKNQIIWGGNYFDLPPTRCIICWDKVQPWENFSQFEMAWTSFDSPARLFRFDNRTGGKIHPTEKPIALYKWLLTNYAKQGDRILDTNGGSFSHAIAAYDLGFDLDIIELDEDYFNAGKARFEAHVTKQTEIKQLGYAKTEISKVNPTLF